MRTHQAALALAALAAAVFMAGCEKDEEAARRFPRTDEPAPRVISELRSLQLANGVSVYLQEEHTDDRVAVEVLYRAGLVHEPADMLQVAHLAEHVVSHSGTASYKPGEALQRVRRHGMAAAEAVGDFVHYSYITSAENLDEVLGIEAERMTSLRVEQDVLEREAENAKGEIAATLTQGGTLLRFGLVAMNQAYHHGAVNLPVEAANLSLTREQVADFHAQYYRPDDMVISMVGGIQLDEAEQLVRKHFEGIASRPAPPALRPAVTKSVRATWDVPAEVTFLAFPCTEASRKERLALTIFGAHLHRQISASEEFFNVMASVYASNLAYPVRDLPFFIYLQARPRQSLAGLRDDVLRLAEATVGDVDEKTTESLRALAEAFMTSTMLKEFDTFSVPHHRTIGQEAFNNGLKHYLREGSSVDEFVALVREISAEDMRATLDKYVVRANMIEISITGGP
jgi:predicted Zn-dependent peptidase